jgi:hypothetical protein
VPPRATLRNRRPSQSRLPGHNTPQSIPSAITAWWLDAFGKARVLSEALWPIETSSQSAAAARALPGIPVNDAATVRAAPPLLLLCKPGVNVDIPLTSNIRQYFSMVWESVIIEVDKFPAGKIGALSTVEQPLFKGTSPKPTNATVGG